MAILTLTTDFGSKDHSVAALKGRILTLLPEITIVDISHDVAPFHLQECAYILGNSYKNFPPDTIHLIGVDSEFSPENEHLMVFADDHYFVGANNGIISLLVADHQISKAVSLDLPNSVINAFPALEIFVEAACHVARGGTLEVLGQPFEVLKVLKDFEPHITNNGSSIVGSIIYVDNYGNAVTNIQKSLFESYRNGRGFEIAARTHKIQSIHNTYNGIIDFDLNLNQRKGPGDVLALFNTSGYIELSIYKSNPSSVGGAATLLGLNYRDRVTVNFL